MEIKDIVVIVGLLLNFIVFLLARIKDSVNHAKEMQKMQDDILNHKHTQWEERLEVTVGDVNKVYGMIEAANNLTRDVLLKMGETMSAFSGLKLDMRSLGDSITNLRADMSRYEMKMDTLFKRLDDQNNRLIVIETIHNHKEK